MSVLQELAQPLVRPKHSVFGLYKSKFWWRRRDSNLRPKSYEFWGLTFAETPRSPYLASTSQKSGHPALGDLAGTVADWAKWVHERVHVLALRVDLFGPLPAAGSSIRLAAIDAPHGCSSDCQVQGGKDLAAYFRPLPDGYWAAPLHSGGIKAWPKIPRAWWPKIAEEYAAGVSGPKLAEMSSSNTRASACFNPA